MPIQTRYMRNDGTLKTTQGTASGWSLINTYDGNVTVTQYFQIHVYHLNGAPALIMSSDIGSSAFGLVHFQCVLGADYDLDLADKIMIRVVADDFSPPAVERKNFTTEALGALHLDAATWECYCYLKKTYNRALDETDYDFKFGNATYNSRIEQFSYTVPASPPGGGGGGMGALAVAMVGYRDLLRRKRRKAYITLTT